MSIHEDLLPRALFVENTASSTVGDLLFQAADQHQDSGLLYATSGQFVRYPELRDEALRVLGGLREIGVRPGQVVVLLPEQGEDFIPALWACFLGGFIACAPAPITDSVNERVARLKQLDKLLDRPFFVTDDLALTSRAAESGLLVAGIEQARLLGATITPHEVQPHRLDPSEVALTMLTSGSTGVAKAVQLTHANLLAALAAKIDALTLTAEDVMLNWVSFDHVAATIETHILPLAAGAVQVHVPPSHVLADPLEFPRLIGRHRVTITFTPNFLLGLVNAELDRLTEPLDADLSAVRYVISGGEANPVSTGVGFLDRLAPYGLHGRALWPAFGMTETCAGSLYNKEFPGADAGAEFAAVGRPVRGLEIRIAAEDGTDVGEVQLRGPMITPGYRDNPDANAASFTDDGWFRTGDLGSMRDGRLTLAGRSKDSIVVNGVNYYSHDLEAVITALPGVEPSFVAAFAIRPPGSDTEELVVAFATDASDETALYRVVTAVRDRAAQHWGFRPALVLPLPQEEFPKTSLGKIQRPLMRRNLESGGYAEHEFAVADLVRRKLGGYTAPEGPTEEILAEVYGQVFGLDPATVSATASFFDLGGTSIDVLRLRRLVEQRLPGTEVTVPQLFGAPTVRLLATRLDAAGDLPYDPIVPLQTSGSGTPLFCVHPAGAEVLVFVALAKHFTGERPFYALRFRGFGADEEPFGSWDEMVGCYVDAIRRTQPEGPYALTGYSLGGAIAFDVAKRLEAAGERVDFYCSIDLPPHIPDIDVFDFACTATNLALFVGLTNVEQLETLPPLLRGLSHEDQLAHLIGLASPARLAELDLDLAQFSEWVHIAHALVTAAKTYEPTDTVEGVTVLYASPLRWTEEDWSARIRRWDEHSRTPVRYRRVPGEHHTLLGPEFVAAFHQVLDAELKRALGED